jgi:hypothetical protein
VELPLWFLLVSLALPRTCLVAAYFLGQLPGFVLNGWVSPTLCVVIPRIVIIILIFQARGMSPWLLLHGIAMAGAYSEGGSRTIHNVVWTKPPAGGRERSLSVVFKTRLTKFCRCLLSR